MFYVYRHIRLDTNTVFYVGKGLKHRPYSTHGRNKYWKNIVALASYHVEIVEEFSDELLAYSKENELIVHYKNLGLCEANLTTGSSRGGPVGIKRCFTEEHKKKIAIANTGQSRPNPHKGKPTNRPAWNKGKDCPVFAKAVIDVTTGIIYDSIKQVASINGLKYTTLRAKLTGQNKNDTNWRLL